MLAPFSSLSTLPSWPQSPPCLMKTSGWSCPCQALWPILGRQPTPHLDMSPHPGDSKTVHPAYLIVELERPMTFCRKAFPFWVRWERSHPH